MFFDSFLKINAHTLETNCMYLMSKHTNVRNTAGLLALNMNMYVRKDGKLLYFVKKTSDSKTSLSQKSHSSNTSNNL